MEGDGILTVTEKGKESSQYTESGSYEITKPTSTTELTMVYSGGGKATLEPLRGAAGLQIIFF